MGLAEKVLALHEGIREVFILEERAGQFVVVEEATRDKPAILSNDLSAVTKGVEIAPALILGAAAQYSKTPGSLRTVGMLYTDLGIILAYLDESKLLSISTEPSSFSAAMQQVNDALPGLIKELETVGKGPSGVKSVTEAGQIARNYVTKESKASRIILNEVTYRAANHLWEIHGTYRSSRVLPSREFELEVDGEEGAIMGFRSIPSSSSVVLALELVSLLAALSFVVWWIFTNVFRR
jgi:hypothetical protein